MLLRLLHLLLVCLLAAPVQAQVLQFREALAAPGNGSAFPAAGARVVALPDDWQASHPGHSGSMWYRMAFDQPAGASGEQLLGLYIERACSNVRVRLNGRLVHAAGRMATPPSRNCQRPLLVGLPTGLMVAQGNLLDVQVVGHALAEVASRQRVGGLSVLELGPYTQLAERHALRHALAITLPQVASATLWLMGGFMLLLAGYNRRHTHLAYFGLLLGGWGLLLLRLWWADPPLPHAVAEGLIVTLLGVITWALVQYLVRYAGQRWRWLDVVLPLQALAVPALLAAAGPQRVFSAATVCYAVLALELVAAVAWFLRHTRAHRPHQLGPVLLMMVLGLVSVAAELGAQQLPLAQVWVDLAHVLLPLVMLAQSLYLVLQFGRALQDSEHNRAELELRIREATAQIERNFAQLSELKVEQVTERERKRIAADLHDDLGAKLLTIVHTSDSERISTLAREALEEMRLSVRGLTGKPVRLLDALGDWRAEVVSRLAQAGMEGEWQAPADEVPQTLSARAFVQTTRILREAVSNIIKHSGASRCSVRCAIADGDFQLIIQDNGNGIPMELDGRLDRGHGMSTMKHRAKQMQGQCLVESGPGYGTVIRLTLPLEQHVAQA